MDPTPEDLLALGPVAEITNALFGRVFGPVCSVSTPPVRGKTPPGGGKQSPGKPEKALAKISESGYTKFNG